MAKIVYADLVSDIRGKLGGAVWSANRSGPYIKSLSQPTKATTLRQSLSRASLAAMGPSWLTLSDAQRAAWAVYAALAAQEQTDSLGNPFYLSGFNWFAKCNLAKQRWSSVLQVSVPTTPAPTTNAISAVYFDEVIGTFYAGVMTYDPDLGSDMPVIAVAPVWDTKRLSLTAGFRIFKPVQTVDGDDSYWDIVPAQFVSYWGTPYDGVRLFFKVWIQSDRGRRSPAYQDFADYVPL